MQFLDGIAVSYGFYAVAILAVSIHSYFTLVRFATMISLYLIYW